MLGVFAEFETNLRRERQAEGIAAAKQRGAYRGRPPRIDMEAICIGWPRACRQRKSPASPESHAGPSTLHCASADSRVIPPILRCEARNE